MTQYSEIPPSNFLLSLALGSITAVICAGLWALITVTTNYQIGFMAVGVGVAVGYAVRMGKGSTAGFGILGAVLSLFGCLLGNLLTACGFVASQQDVPVTSVIAQLNPDIAMSLMSETFNGMDILFYAIAIYEGFKLSRVVWVRVSQVQPA